MNTTKHATEPAAEPKAGRFVSLCALLHHAGIGASKIGGGFPHVGEGTGSMSVRGYRHGRKLSERGSAVMRIAVRGLALRAVMLSVAVMCGSAALYVFGVGVASAAGCPNEALRTGAAAMLPDCRAYEQVSPTEKGGFAATTNHAQEAQVSPNGERIAYFGYSAFPGAAGNTALAGEHLSTRGASGWETSELTPAKTGPNPDGAYVVTFEAFSEGLSEWVVLLPDQRLTPEATPGVNNLFVRHEDGAYTWVNAAAPADPLPVACDEDCFQAGELAADASNYAGASRGFEHVIFESNSTLTPEAPKNLQEDNEYGLNWAVNTVQSLYEMVGGKVRLVGILPDGKPAAEGSEAGSGSPYQAGGVENTTVDQRVEHAISEDGSRVVFEAKADGGTPAEAGQAGETEVYDRIGAESTVELSAPAPGATPSSSAGAPAQFWAASADGSRVFFTSEQELTSDSTAASGEPDLYEYEFAGAAGAAVSLKDLTVESNHAEHAHVLGVVDASQNGEYVYFVAKGVLADGAKAGEPNLYMVHAGAGPVFIATLSTADERDWTPQVGELQAYITPDGADLAFMSKGSLPSVNYPAGYDNSDLSTGEPDSEVYEYSAPSAAQEAAGGAGTLVCGSCELNGARPTGNAVLAGTEEEGSSTPFFHHARGLSEDGARLFFTAPPSAGERAFDGAETPYAKLFEHEVDGEGSCTVPGGCTFLISSPTSESTDLFLDASASGNDVFFSTEAQLTSSDQDHLRDVYDARVDGGMAAAVGAAECQSACRSSGGSVPGGPSLPSGLTGPSGNLAPPVQATKLAVSGSKAKLKALSTEQELVKALKACKKVKGKERRALCERRAERRYGKKRGVAAKAKSTRRANS